MFRRISVARLFSLEYHGRIVISVRDLEFLGAALAVLRRRSGKMQKEISDETGMSRSQVSRYERGRDTPNLVTLVRYLSTIGSDFRALHEALQEIKISAGAGPEDEGVASLDAFERALTDRLAVAPEMRLTLYELLKPLFLEVEQIRRRLEELQGEPLAPRAAEDGGETQD